MKRVLIYFIGLLVMSLGICLMIKSGLGLSSYDAFGVGLSNRIGYSPGLWFMVCGIILIFINSFLLKSKPSITSFLTSILAGAFIDFWIYMIQVEISNIGYQYIYLTLGLIVYALGIALYINANIAKSPLETLMIAISQISGKSLRFAKTVNELIFLFLSFLIGGPIGIGTIVSAVTSGFFIQFFNDIIVKINHNNQQNKTARQRV